MLLSDRHAQTNRWRHRALAEKASFALGLLALAVTLPPLPVTAPCVLLATLLAAGVGARVPWWDYLRILSWPLGFVALGALTLAVQWGPNGLGLAQDGGALAIATAARAMAAASCLIFLSVTTPLTDLVAGLRRLKLPEAVVEIMLATYRFLFLLMDEARKMHVAQAARLGDATRRRQLAALGRITALLLPRALARARALETGLAARNYQGRLRVLSPQRAAAPGVLLAILSLHGVILGAALWLM